jgi:hypothetical protein
LETFDAHLDGYMHRHHNIGDHITAEQSCYSLRRLDNKQMNGDKYPDMGIKLKRFSLDDCLEEVKKKYPTAYMEGAAGLGRSFFIRSNPHPLLVGVCWSSGKPTKDWNYIWWVRVAPEPREW